MAASLVQLRNSPMKSSSGKSVSMSQSRSPSAPRTPVLSPHVNRFLIADLTNTRKEEQESPSTSVGGTPAVPAFSAAQANMSPMELGSSHDGIEHPEVGRKSLLKQVHRNTKRMRESEEGSERRRVSTRRATVEI